MSFADKARVFCTAFFLLVFLGVSGVPEAVARECDLQAIQDKVDAHFSESKDSYKRSLRNIAHTRNEKNGTYYAFLYDTQGTTHRERNKGYIKMAMFFCSPVMMTVRPVPDIKTIKAELNKEAKVVKNIQINDNFEKAQRYALFPRLYRDKPLKVIERNPE